MAPTESTPAPAPSTSEPSEDVAPKRWVGVVSTITSVLLLLTLLATIVVAHPILKGRAADLGSAEPRVSFYWPPLAGLNSSDPLTPGGEPRTWINAEIRGDLERLVLKRLTKDPFDRAGLIAAREELIRTGWLKDDLVLVRDEDGLVRIGGTWRVPVAAVRFNDRDHLVTSVGELLPLSYGRDTSGFKVILGVATPPPEPGKVWIGGEVQAALKLLAHLAAVQGVHQIAAIDTTEFSASRSLSIITDRGNRILWGGPVDAFNPGQAPATTKLARLSRIYREHGRVDASRSMLDVRLADGVYVHDTSGVLARADEAASHATDRPGSRVRR